MNQNMINKNGMTIFESIVFLLLFVLPFPILCVIPPERSIQIQYIFIVGYLLLFIIKNKYLSIIFNNYSIFIVLIYVSGALIKYFVYGHLTITSVLLPIVAFFGYYYVVDKHIKLVVFDVLMIVLYIYFIITYYSKLPSLFMRTQFDDGSWYGSSSSNSIPIILVNVLYIYEVLTYLQKDNRRGRLFAFAVINLILIIMQQSRAGVLVSLLFVIWNLFQLRKTSKNIILRFSPWLITLLGIIWLINNKELINEYIDVVGDVSLTSYENDVRSKSVKAFFNNMTFYEFVYGYPSDNLFYGDTSYTFNTFVDHWNKYTIIGLLLTITILFNRLIKHNKYYFPLVYLIPFFLYGWVEPRYLPNYWDFFIYIILFKKCESPKLTRVSSRSQLVM